MIKPKKKYLLILYVEAGNYSVTEFDTIEEALLADRHTNDFYIAESVNGLSVYGRFEKPKEDGDTQ